jgi:hypothetical protein
MLALIGSDPEDLQIKGKPRMTFLSDPAGQSEKL